MNDTEKELDLLLNSEKEVKLGDKKIIVHKVSMLDSIKLVGQLSTLVNALIKDSEAASSALTLLTATPEDSSSDNIINLRLVGIAQLLAIVGTEGAEVVADIVDKCTNLTYDEINDISAEDGIDLLIDIFEVNKSFFTKLSTKLQEKVAKGSLQKKKKA